MNDMNLAENSFVPGIGELKGKSTRRKTKPVKYDVVEIKTELIDQYKYFTHWMETLFVNDIPMLTGIDRIIGYQSLVFLNIGS